jgi:hypothetical protein
MFFTVLCFFCTFFTVKGVFCLGSCSIESAGWRPRTFLDCVFFDCVFLGEGVVGLAAGMDRLTVPHGDWHQGWGLGGGDRFTVLLRLGGGDRLAVLLMLAVGGAGHQGGGAGVAAGGYRPDVWDRLRRWGR